MNKSKTVIWSVTAVIAVGLASVGAQKYLAFQQQKKEKATKEHIQAEYASDMKTAKKDIAVGKLESALRLVKEAKKLDSTSQAIALSKALRQTEAHTLKITDPKANGSYPLYIPQSGSQTVGYKILAIANTQANLQQYQYGVSNQADYDWIVDSAAIGTTMYVAVTDPNGNNETLKASIVALDKGSIGETGFYTNGRYGDGFTLPTLNVDGISYGWIPAAPAADGSGRSFTDPLDQNVSIMLYGMNNALNAPLQSNIPASAQIINSNLSIGNNQGIEYKDLESQSGVNTITEGIVVGSSYLPTMNGIAFTVPESELTKWQPIINQTLDGFIPGDLTEPH